MKFFIMIVAFACAQPLQQGGAMDAGQFAEIYMKFMNSYLGGGHASKPAEFKAYEKRSDSQHDMTEYEKQKSYVMCSLIRKMLKMDC